MTCNGSIRIYGTSAGIDYQQFSGDLELEPGLQLLHTPGHARGQLSVYVETATGPVILAIDALADGAAVRDDPLPSFYVEDRARLGDIANSTTRARPGPGGHTPART